MEFKDLTLLEIGNTVQLVGAIWGGWSETENNRVLYACVFPDEWEGFMPFASVNPDRSGVVLEPIFMDSQEWETFLRQTDIMETEMLVQARDGKVTKAILRKSARQIDQSIAWKVFARDGFKCRYCGKGPGIPLSVDHLVLWEVGGPSIEKNLLSACKPCNRTRGSMPFEEWLASEEYFNHMNDLDYEVHQANLALVDTLDEIPRKIHQASR